MLTPAEQERHARAFIPEVLDYAARKASFSQGDPESAALVGLARALRSWNPQGRASLRTWVFGIVRHELQHDRRDGSELPRRDWEWHTRSMEELPPHYLRPVSLSACYADSRDPLEECVPDLREPAGKAVESEAWVSEVLRHVTPRQAVLLRLVVLEEISQTQAGPLVGISQMQVSRDVRTALARLRELVGGEG